MLLEPNKGNRLIMLVVVFLLLAGGIWAWTRNGFAPESGQSACPLDAKICPDGSAVGRSGPDCEFAACPAASSSPTVTPPTTNPPGDWVVYNDATSSATFRYPAELPTLYIRAFDWPPHLEIIDREFSCTEGGSEIMPAGQTSLINVNGHEYCMTRESEGAAGSIYTQYSYAFPQGDRTAILSFTTQAPQCGNYDPAPMAACEQERQSFDINTIVDQMAQSLEL